MAVWKTLDRHFQCKIEAKMSQSLCLQNKLSDRYSFLILPNI
jgi:hypothetical protein